VITSEQNLFWVGVALGLLAIYAQLPWLRHVDRHWGR
jgi:hypothetical protein